MPSSICVEANLRSVLPLDAEIHQTKIAVRHDARWRQARRRTARPHRAGAPGGARPPGPPGSEALSQAHEKARSEEHTSELQSLMRISYAVFCLKKKKTKKHKK